MGTETSYQRIPTRFGLHVPNVIIRDAQDANVNFREIERVVNALPFNAVIVVTSTTRPLPVNIGTVIYETDTGKVLIWNGSAWVTIFDPAPATVAYTAFTPTAKFGATTLSIANNDSRYFKSDRFVEAEYRFRISNLNGGTGTFTLSYPVTPRDPTTGFNLFADVSGEVGAGDVSGPARYYGRAQMIDTVSWRITDGLGAGGAGTIFWAHNSPFTFAAGGLATGDEFYGKIVFESAA